MLEETKELTVTTKSSGQCLVTEQREITENRQLYKKHVLLCAHFFVLLEIVNQLDGFDARGNIKVLMATNR